MRQLLILGALTLVPQPARESARQPRRQIFRDAEDLSPAILTRDQQSSGR